jgi:hypothetical protein
MPAITRSGVDPEAPQGLTTGGSRSNTTNRVGTATGSDGRQYNLETDMRAMEGPYIAEDGSRQRGLFALT